MDRQTEKLAKRHLFAQKLLRYVSSTFKRIALLISLFWVLLIALKDVIPPEFLIALLLLSIAFVAWRQYQLIVKTAPFELLLDSSQKAALEEAIQQAKDSSNLRDLGSFSDDRRL